MTAYSINTVNGEQFTTTAELIISSDPRDSCTADVRIVNTKGALRDKLDGRQLVILIINGFII